MGAFIFLCVTLVVTAVAGNSCGERDYTCPGEGDGSPVCVTFRAMCDGTPDCQDGTDEQEAVCESHLGAACRTNGKFYCKSGRGRNRCISRLRLCDGRQNCHDRRDENVTLCGMAPACDDSIYTESLESSERYVSCTGSHQCIQSSRWCDHNKDCANNADETPSCEYAKIRDEALRAHNTLRNVHQNTPPVTWNLDLASRSQLWADYLLYSGIFNHSQDPSEFRKASGENIYRSSRFSANLTNAIYACYSEEWESNYDYSTGTGTDTIGHFTQVVWDTSTEIGCGVARSEIAGTFVVCQYTPPGNYRGTYPSHVFRPKPGVDPKTVADALKSNA